MAWFKAPTAAPAPTRAAQAEAGVRRMLAGIRAAAAKATSPSAKAQTEAYADIIERHLLRPANPAGDSTKGNAHGY